MWDRCTPLRDTTFHLHASISALVCLLSTTLLTTSSRPLSPPLDHVSACTLRVALAVVCWWLHLCRFSVRRPTSAMGHHGVELGQTATCSASVGMADALATFVESLKRSAARPRSCRMDRTDALRVVRARKALRRGVHRTSTRIASMPAPPRRNRRAHRSPRASTTSHATASRVGESYQARVPRRATYFKPTKALGNWPSLPTERHQALLANTEATLEEQLRSSWSVEETQAFDKAVRVLGTDLRAVKALLPKDSSRSMRDVVAYFYTVWRCDEAKRRKDESLKNGKVLQAGDLEDEEDPDCLSAHWRKFYDEDDAFAKGKSPGVAAREAAFQKNKVAALEGLERMESERLQNGTSEAEAVRTDEPEIYGSQEYLVQSRPSTDPDVNGLQMEAREEPTSVQVESMQDAE